MTWRRSSVLSSALTLWLNCQSSDAFAPFLSSCPSTTSTSLFAMNRKARRMQKKQQESKGKARLREIITDDDDDDSDVATTYSKAEVGDDPVYIGHDEDEDIEQEEVPTAKDSVTSGATTMADKVAQIKEERPEVSRIVVDEETGMEIMEQGQKVMDVVTRRAVKLSDLGPMYRLAQMFPGVPPEIREKYRFDRATADPVDIINAFREACSVKLEDGTVGIPPTPSIANNGLDFVIANRDLLGGYNFKRVLTRMMLRNQWLEDLDAARDYKTMAQHYFLMENHISAPFRQMMFDGEERIGPNFGNLDLKSYCGKEIYERVADYLVLKGMVAHWAQKYRDAEEVAMFGPANRENLAYIIATGDPKRYLKESQIIWEKKDCEQILAMALKMCNAYVGTPELFNDLPVEVRFLERASTIQDGTTLRKFVLEEFCPAEEIEPEGLREGLRRLHVQLDNMQVDPYEDIWFVVDRILGAIEKGSPDERNPFYPYLEPDFEGVGPAHFETYTFDVPKESIIRFLDQDLERMSEETTVDVEDIAESVKGIFSFAGELFGLPEPERDDDDVRGEDETAPYKVPEVRAAGRAHELGWLDNIDHGPERGDPSKPGRIIFEE